MKKHYNIGKDNGGYIDGRNSKIYYCIKPNCNNIVSDPNRRCSSCGATERFKDPKNHPNYIDNRSNKTYYCLDCGGEISYQSVFYGSGLCRSCSKKENRNYWYGKKRPEHSEKISKENNPNWQDGVNEEGYSYKFNNELKEQIRKRDNYTCQKCGCSQLENGRQLDVHHVDYDKENCRENNLISLCHECNIIANYNRDYWFAYFTYIIEDKSINKSLKKEVIYCGNYS